MAYQPKYAQKKPQNNGRISDIPRREAPEPPGGSLRTVPDGMSRRDSPCPPGSPPWES